MPYNALFVTVVNGRRVLQCLEAHEKTAKATVTGYEEKIARLSERLEHSETLIDAAQQECEARSRQITEADSEICQV